MNYLSDTNHTGMWLRLWKPFAIMVLWAAIAFAFLYRYFAGLDGCTKSSMTDVRSRHSTGK
jgi:hypothetical protein